MLRLRCFIPSAMLLFLMLDLPAPAASASSAPAAASTVDTDPLNHDPLVREAFEHFYNLDYDGALSRFERIAAAHVDDPIATTYVLDCVLFRELYRLPLLRTTLYY